MEPQGRFESVETLQTDNFVSSQMKLLIIIIIIIWLADVSSFRNPFHLV